MAKVNIKSLSISGEIIVREFNVTLVTIANYGNAPADFYIGGIKRTLPAVSVDYGVPVAPFRVENCGHDFDIELSFSANATNVVVDFMQLANNNKDC